MLFSPLPIIEPRDSHTLWHAPSQPYRTNNPGGRSGHQQQQNANTNSRRNTSGNNASRHASGHADPLAALALEERALRVRKQNIASFGFSWIRPAGFPKTMLGIREEELEREEGAAAAAAADTGQEIVADEGDPEQLAALEGDLDGDIPDADEDGMEDEEEEGETGEGRALVEQGERDMEEEDEDGLMGRDLDNEILDGFGDDYEDEQRDLDADVPSASENGFNYDDDDEEEEEHEDLTGGTGGDRSMMARNLDSDIPDPGEEQEWEHTDTDADDDDDEDEEEDMDMDLDQSRRQRRHHQQQQQQQQQLPRQSLPRSSLSALAEPIPLLPPQQPRQETEAERLFLARWSDGGSAGFESTEMMPEPHLRIPRRRTRRYSAQSGSEDGIE